MVDERRIEMLGSRVQDAQRKLLETLTRAKQRREAVAAWQGNLKRLQTRARKARAQLKPLAEMQKLVKRYETLAMRLGDAARAAQAEQRAREKDIARLRTGFQNLEALKEKGDEKSAARAEALEASSDQLADTITKGLRSVGADYEKARAMDKELGALSRLLERAMLAADKEIAEAEKAAKKKK